MRFANKETNHSSLEPRGNIVGVQRDHSLDEAMLPEPNNPVAPEAMDSFPIDAVEDLRQAYIVNKEAHDIRVVGARQDTCPKLNLVGEDTAKHSIAPPINHTDKSMEDLENVCKANQETFAPGLSFPDLSFSIGLTQMNKSNAVAEDHVAHLKNEEASLPVANLDKEALILNRKRKRAKVVPRNLVGEYQCDKRFLTRAWESFVNAICSTPSIDYRAKFTVLLGILGGPSFVIDFGGLTVESCELSAIVDRSSHLTAKMLGVLIYHTCSLFLSNLEHMHSKNAVFLDTKFMSLLSKSFTKFSKAAKKENVRFPAALCSFVAADCPIAEVSRIYFPFNFDKQHWVGVCVDVSMGQLIVLDCNTYLKTDAMVAMDLQPITQLFPYILRQEGKQLTVKEMKPLTIDRPRVVLQNINLLESGITTVLLIQAHAVGGVDVCKCITPEVLDTEVQRIAVMMYEENVAVL